MDIMVNRPIDSFNNPADWSSVGATDYQGKRASFSAVGEALELVAPGECVLTSSFYGGIMVVRRQYSGNCCTMTCSLRWYYGIKRNQSFRSACRRCCRSTLGKRYVKKQRFSSICFRCFYHRENSILFLRKNHHLHPNILMYLSSIEDWLLYIFPFPN